MKRLFILLLLIVSCKSKQIVTETKETVKIDTVYKFKDRIIDRPVIDSIIIEKPCDSLGNLKPFKGVLKTNHAKITIEAKNGRIEAQINIDSIVSLKLKEYKSKIDKTKEVKETTVIKYRWPWWVVYLIGYSALITAILLKKVLLPIFQ